jgi:serine protease AprX
MKRSSPCAAAGVGLVLSGLLALGVGAARTPSLASSPLPAAPSDSARPASSFIVQLREPQAPDDVKTVLQAGARITRRYHALPMVAVSASAPALERLAALPCVKHISPDRAVCRTMEYARPAVGADVAQQSFGVTGKGIGVALIDSGIDPHPDLGAATENPAGRVVAGYDFVKDSPKVINNDQCGHGSNIAGIIAGDGSQSSIDLSPASHTTRSFRGIAPGVNLINLRILDRDGAGSVSDAIAALDWCIQNRDAYNLRVANLSLGHPVGESYTTDPLCQAAERAVAAGILVVCAAGNNGRNVPSDPESGAAYGSINSPGNDPLVLTVGAINDQGTPERADDWVTTYSSRGPSRLDHVVKPDLAAPGNRIIATRHPGSSLEMVLAPENRVPTSYYWQNPPNSVQTAYYQLSGTSMAAGVVSGAAALLFEADSTLTPADVKARLMTSADKVWHSSGETPDIFSRGSGYLNIPVALQCPYRVESGAPSPTASLSGDEVLLEMQQALWGEKRTSLSSGKTPTWSLADLLGQQALWGEKKTAYSSQSTWTNYSVYSYSTVAGDVSRIAISGE